MIYILLSIFTFYALSENTALENRRTAFSTTVPTSLVDHNFETCAKPAELILSQQASDWSTINGKLEHFLHFETQFMLLCLILSCLICLNWVAIWRFFTGTTKKSCRLSDFEAMKLAVSETAAGICVFSLFMTTVAPLVRLFRKKWFTVTPFFSINESLGMHFHEHSISQNAGPDYDLKPAQDFSWIGHAIFGLLWVLLGFAAIRSGASKSSKMHRKYIGKLAMVSLFCHFLFSCSNVFLDAANHTWMNKICLLSSWPSIFLNITIAMVILGDKRLNREEKITIHMRHMFLGWIQSIEGSGQIRLIGTLNYLSGNLVTHYCKNHLYSFSGSECAWKYLERGFFATVVSSVYLCIYSWRNPADKVMRKLVIQMIPDTVIGYGVMKLAAYFDAQYIISAIQLIKIMHNLLQIVSIIRNHGIELPELSPQTQLRAPKLYEKPMPIKLFKKQIQSELDIPCDNTPTVPIPGDDANKYCWPSAKIMDNEGFYRSSLCSSDEPVPEIEKIVSGYNGCQKFT